MKIALVGNQNSGKSTLFNALTGSNQKIGNWPGVTVEKKVGYLKGTGHEIVDLPGIYSLSPYTNEEKISRNFLLTEKPDLIINTIDATSLERSLYLTTQLLELDCKVIVALNMCDLLEKKGLTIDENKLQGELGVNIVKISALKKHNLDGLIKIISHENFYKKDIKIYNERVENLIDIVVKNGAFSENKRFLAVKTIERDFDFDLFNNSNKKHNKKNNENLDKNFNENNEKNDNNLDENLNKNNKKFDGNYSEKNVNNGRNFDKNNDENAQNNEQYLEKIEKEIKEIEASYNIDIEQIIANERYNYIVKAKKECVVQRKKAQTITDKLDKIFLNKWLAIPLFLVIMGLVYFLSVGIVGTFTVDLIDSGVSGFSDLVAEWLISLNASEWAVSLLCNGMIAGVGAVLNFVPQLIIIFLCISLLETTGYMSRISFFFDKFFRKIGLSGKSLVPFIVGSGCSVPAIMSTRTIENENEKRATIMLTPFIPCSAKLPIIALFSGYFFKNSWLVTTSLYFMSVALIIISAFIIRKFFLKGQDNTFISELPEYKMPNFKYIFKDVFDKTFAFVKRAGTIILLCSIVIWVLVSFDFSFTYGVSVEDSILAKLGNCLAWFFYPILGEYSWSATVCAIQGLVAKEQVVSSMAVISGLAEDVASGSLIFSKSGIFGFFTPVSAYAFMVFNLFSAPCFGAIGAMHKELGNTKKTFIAIAFQTGVAWIMALLVSFIGNLISVIF